MNRLYNYGGPHKTSLKIEMLPFDKYVLFPYELYENNCTNKVKEEDIKNGPSSFMVGIRATKEILDSISEDNITICKDIFLYCKVVLKMVDDIYIPSRKPNLNKTIEKVDWLFPFSEVYEN